MAAVGAGRRAAPHTRGVVTHFSGLKPHLRLPRYHILVPRARRLARCRGSAGLCERRRAAGGDLSLGTRVTTRPHSDVAEPVSGAKASSSLCSLFRLCSAPFLFD